MNERLPGFVLAELFRKSLVIAEDPASQTSSKDDIKNPVNWFLGSYEKKIVVLVNDPENLFLDDSSLQFLTGILTACKLNLGQVALINFNKHPVSYKRLKKDLQPQSLLLFGISAMQIELPFDMPEYKVQSYDNCTILIAPPLQILNSIAEETKKQKAMLWNCLKKMFDLK